MVERLLNRITTVDHYLYDLRFARSSATQDCAVFMSKSISFADYMGIPLADDKAVWFTRLTYYGFAIDTSKIVTRIPQHKVVSLHPIIKNFYW